MSSANQTWLTVQRLAGTWHAKVRRQQPCIVQTTVTASQRQPLKETETETEGGTAAHVCAVVRLSGDAA